MNCISCKGDDALFELFDDGSGYCVKTCDSIIDCAPSEFCNMENRQSKGPSVCEPCVPKEYYSMKDVCNLESYTLQGAQACEYKCFDQPLPAGYETEEDDAEFINATSLLIFFTLYLVIM